MDAKQLKQILTVEQIVQLMHHLGADSRNSGNDNEILFSTICHGGDSHKLYFFKDSKEFHCYTNCGHMDIINIVEQVLKVNMSQAMTYIQNMFGIGNFTMIQGFFDDDVINKDLEILDSYTKETKVVDMSREFKYLDSSILDGFYKMYHPAFYNDGISIKTLHKFGIRYDILEHRIIIPHLDELGGLVAVRCRNLNQDLIDEGKKYIPIVVDKKLLSAKTSLYFYGMYYNQENIKRARKVILLESEKAVMQLDTILGENNIGLALSSSSLSLVQVGLLKQMNVEEVIVAVDKEYHEFDTEEEKKYAIKVRKGIINKLLPYFNVSVIWDKEGLIGFKDSPTDKGRETFLKLFKSRIEIER